MVALDKLDYCASLANLAPVAGSPNFKFVRGDLQVGGASPALRPRYKRFRFPRRLDASREVGPTLSVVLLDVPP